MVKRIVLLLDGTWNDADSGDNDTNIVRLEDGIVRYLRRESEENKTSESRASSDQKAQHEPLVHSIETQGYENFVYYQRGVGTGFMDIFRGGIFGEGIADNIRRAYKFLSHHYEKGDQIFIFGFSRGAFTARSVAGYIHSAGLLARQHCNRENEEAAWNYYRTAPADRLPGDWLALTPLVHNRESFRISCLGVFDTVGALGIPLELFNRRNRQSYAFHDVTLSSITDVNLHAMAIDELRKPFGATLWRRPRFKQYHTHTEQVWFTGVHADVGGGYISAQQRRSERTASLDDITYDWMIKRLKYHFKDFPIDLHQLEQEKCVVADQHNSRRRYYKLLKLAYRTVANTPIPREALRLWQTLSSYDRRDEAIGEAVHISVLERLGKEVRMGSSLRPYCPPNLLHILPRIEATYTRPGEPGGVLVVDWDGKQIAETNPIGASRVLGLIKEATSRIGKY